MVPKRLRQAYLRIVSAWLSPGMGEPLWPGQAICGHDSLWPLMERSLLRTDHILLENRTGGISGRFGDGCEVEMLASEENAEVVSDREKEGN